MVDVSSLRWWILAVFVGCFIGWKLWKDPKWFGKIFSTILGERGEKRRGSGLNAKKQEATDDESEDVVDTINYRGVEYEIDWKNRRFLRVWQDEKTKEFRSQSVKLPYHIWDEVFGEDEEEEEGDEDDDEE